MCFLLWASGELLSYLSGEGRKYLIGTCYAEMPFSGLHFHFPSIFSFPLSSGLVSLLLWGWLKALGGSYHFLCTYAFCGPG